jgi:ATP-dependent DNA helicase DinG
MEESAGRFSQPGLDALRGAIEEAAGNEVFALATLEDGAITDVRILARGHSSATPALLQVPRPGEVVVHNHPSGNLQPSDADLSVASALGNRGVGSYIVDNQVRRVYVVVEPLAEQKEVLLIPDEVAHYLSPEGPIAASLQDYEHRGQQVEMLGDVVHAFNDHEVLTVEAGTGTGKSFAYLLPAILWSTTNRARVIVSTHTINLQEQLVGKDLPLLAERTGLEFTAALVKGRGNYLCQRKAAQVEAQAQLIEDDVASELRALLAWAKNTKDGSLADLATRPRPAVWDQVISESDNTLRARCPYYSTCFFYQARRSAAAADILVVNHHLLLADLALRGATDNYGEQAVLPPSARIIIDEAHHLEDVATTHFGFSTGLVALQRSLGRLQSRRDSSRGVLPGLMLALESVANDAASAARSAAQWIEERLLERRDTLHNEAEQVFAETTGEVLDILGDPAAAQNRTKLRITEDVRATPLWRAARKRLTGLAASADAFSRDLAALLERVEPVQDSIPQQVSFLLTEVAAQCRRLQATAGALTTFLEEDSEHCRWFEVRQSFRGPATVSFHSAPIAVATLLEKGLFKRFETVVMTSATLAVGASFDHLHERLGVDRIDPPERSRSALIASPFDFEQQALLLAVSSLPDPSSADYEPSTHEAMHLAVRLSGGGTFILFTSHGALNRAHQALLPLLGGAGLRVFKQGDTNRHQLLSNFAKAPNAVLFGTDSFWEGVDVRGDALRCVIIPRLPFTVPTEPIEQARVDWLREQGRNPFVEHTLPNAVLKLKQGFGRLIRSRADRGCVLILDSRLARKQYGRTFLRSLPPARQVVGPAHQVFHEMRSFFTESDDGNQHRPAT